LAAYQQRSEDAASSAEANVSKRNLFGAGISAFSPEVKSLSMDDIRFAKEKGRMIAARPTRCATLTVVVVIQVFVGARTAFGAD
jgi:hypothetical protein